MTRDMMHLSVCVHLLANGNGYYQATLDSLYHLHMLCEELHNA